MIEGMAQTARRAVHRVGRRRQAPKAVYFMTIDKAKFRKPVVPGDTIEYHMKQDGATAGTCGGTTARPRSRANSSPRPKSAP